MVLSCAIPYTANAANYTSHHWPGCGGGYNAGSWDDNGLVYVPCGNPSTIGVYNEHAELVRSIGVDTYVSDVAPTPDGEILYLATISGHPIKLVRQADGSYVCDRAWRLANYMMWGNVKYTYSPRGAFLATDAHGRLYLADGYWSPNNTHTVLVYNQNGTLETQFGEWEKSWRSGIFYWALGGIAVTRDGTTIYTPESGNNRIQTWRRQDDGTYRAVSSFGGNEANNADREGYCKSDGWLGTFAAPYAVRLDQQENLYVVNTTCKQVLSFTPNFGKLRANIDLSRVAANLSRPHGFAVGRDGTIYVGENQRLLRPNTEPLPASAKAPEKAPKQASEKEERQEQNADEINYAGAAAGAEPSSPSFTAVFSPIKKFEQRRSSMRPDSPTATAASSATVASRAPVAPPALRVTKITSHLIRNRRSIRLYVRCSKNCVVRTNLRQTTRVKPSKNARSGPTNGAQSSEAAHAARVQYRTRIVGVRTQRIRRGGLIRIVVPVNESSVRGRARLELQVTSPKERGRVRSLRGTVQLK